MEPRGVRRIVVLGAEGRLVTELKTALRRQDGSPEWAVVSRSRLCRLDPGACALLVLDVDGQVHRRLALLTRWRGLYPQVPALVLVPRGDTATAVAAMKAGAADCLEKPVEPGRLLSAVTAALVQRPSAAAPAPGVLTETETRVLRLLLAGKTNGEIAAQFGRSRRTIEAHREKIMRKLGVSRVADLVRQAYRLQLIPSPPPTGATPQERQYPSAPGHERE